MAMGAQMTQRGQRNPYGYYGSQGYRDNPQKEWEEQQGRGNAPQRAYNEYAPPSSSQNPYYDNDNYDIRNQDNQKPKRRAPDQPDPELQDKDYSNKVAYDYQGKGKAFAEAKPYEDSRPQ